MFNRRDAIILSQEPDNTKRQILSHMYDYLIATNIGVKIPKIDNFQLAELRQSCGVTNDTITFRRPLPFNKRQTMTNKPAESCLKEEEEW